MGKATDPCKGICYGRAMVPRVEQVRIDGPAGGLAGEWRDAPGRGAVVAPPHPLYGGSLDHPVVQELADALAAGGFATLAFVWRGVGASEGHATGDVDAAAADYQAALARVCARAAGPVVAGGYSFGAATAARVASGSAAVGGLILIAPPVGMMGAAAVGDRTQPTEVLVGDSDSYAPVDELQRLAAGRPGMHVTVLPACDHFFAGVAPAALRAALAGAVARQR